VPQQSSVLADSPICGSVRSAVADLPRVGSEWRRNPGGLFGPHPRGHPSVPGVRRRLWTTLHATEPTVM